MLFYKAVEVNQSRIQEKEEKHNPAENVREESASEESASEESILEESNSEEMFSESKTQQESPALFDAFVKTISYQKYAI